MVERRLENRLIQKIMPRGYAVNRPGGRISQRVVFVAGGMGKRELALVIPETRANKFAHATQDGMHHGVARATLSECREPVGIP